MNNNSDKIVACVDWVGSKAGIDIYELSLMRALNNYGFKTYICSNFNHPESKVTVKNIFNNIGDGKIISGLKIYTGLFRAMFYLKSKRVKWIIYHIFSGSKTDLFATFLAKLFGFKVLIIVHDVESLDTKQDLWVRRLIFNKFNDKITTHNQFSLDELCKIWHLAKDKDIGIINHGNYDELVNHSITASQGFKQFNLDTNCKYFLFFGQIKKVKGLDVFLNAMKYTTTDYKIIIAGKLRDDSWDTYQTIIDNNKLNARVIHYIRHLTDLERELLFNLAYAVVLPYRLVYASGVCSWAFSLGKLVIASDLKPLQEWIDNGINGITFPAGDSMALAKEIDNVVNGVYDINALQKAALEKSAKEFSWNDVGKKYAEFLN